MVRFGAFGGYRAQALIQAVGFGCKRFRVLGSRSVKHPEPPTFLY